VSPGHDGTEAHTLQGARILIVDHDQETRDTLLVTLQEWGAISVAVGSVADAVAALDEVAPDAVMVAIRMPGDPYRFIAAMRRRDAQQRRHTPIFAIVASTLDRRRAGSAGIHLHVGRPLDVARLKLALVNLVHPAA
jgi:CheY-like chemotaxis protein